MLLSHPKLIANALFKHFGGLFGMAMKAKGIGVEGSGEVCVIRSSGPMKFKRIWAFWIDRVLHSEGIESHVVDPASIATSRRRRRPKTDGIDGEAFDSRSARLQAWRTPRLLDGPGADA